MLSRKGTPLRIFSFLFLVVSLISCGGGGSENTGKNMWYERIEGWQTRELACLEYPEYNYDQSDFIVEESVLRDINREVFHSNKYVKDEGIDFWQTSCETIQYAEGDCEDLAILVWRKLRAKGYPDKINGMILSERDGLFHVFVAVYYSEDDFYIIDPTGYFTFNVVPGREFLNTEKINLILWFNMFLIREL
ncbi:MAG: hypothetical protein ACMUIU_01595 [bacterium]